jgi:hypothetical protein
MVEDSGFDGAVFFTMLEQAREQRLTESGVTCFLCGLLWHMSYVRYVYGKWICVSCIESKRPFERDEDECSDKNRNCH